MNWLYLFVNLSFFLALLIILLIYRLVLYQRKLYRLEQEKEDIKREFLELENLLNDSKILFFKHDISGRITYINNAAQTYLGLNPEAVNEISIQSLMCFKKGISWDNYIQQIFQEKESEGVFYLKNADSDVLKFAYKCRGIIEKDLMVGVNGYALREELTDPDPKKSATDSALLKKEIWQNRERYKNTAHNLKNVFAAVLGFSDIIKEENLSKKEIQNYNAEIAAAGKHGIDLLGEWIESPGIEDSKAGRPKYKASAHGSRQRLKTVLKKGKGRIIYVDDNNALLQMYKRLLERLGYSVDGFSSAKEALAAFDQDVNQYDLVITDWLMPEVSGKELVEKIKQRNATVPIIVLSGKNIPDKKNVGIFSILEKPVDPVKISEILAQAVESIAKKS